MIKNITSDNQRINLMLQNPPGNFLKNASLFGCARPARQFMPQMPVCCMQDFYKVASINTNPSRSESFQLAFLMHFVSQCLQLNAYRNGSTNSCLSRQQPVSKTLVQPP